MRCPRLSIRRLACSIGMAAALCLPACTDIAADPGPVPPPALLTPIFAVQGRGATSPLTGRVVTLQGAVTRVDDNGFFLQDVAGDGDPSTSDAIFVHVGSPPPVDTGQCVRVTGRVAEYDAGAAGNAETSAHSVTELHDVGPPQVLGAGCAVVPVDVTLPLASGDDLERLEGMLVRLHGPLTVQQNYWLGRFGILSLASGGRAQAATNRLRPGPQAWAFAAAQSRRAIVLDDGSSRQHPWPPPFLGTDGTVRAGDVTPEVVGVIDYGLATAQPSGHGTWKIHPTRPVVFERANPRTAAPAAVGGALRVAAANVDNFFSTIADGNARCAPSHTQADCRGARSVAEFELQRAKLGAELAALDADVIGLMEIQNNGPVALRALVDALDAASAPGAPPSTSGVPRPTSTSGARPGWALIPDPPEGSGTDAIKVALVYRPDRVRPVGAAQSDASAIHNRSPLAQTFERLDAQGHGLGRLNVVVSHFKSRRCQGAAGAELDQGDLQGCWNHRRVLQAQALLAFVDGIQRRSGVADTLLIGDFNAYALEDPIEALTAHGFIDAAARFDPSGYSFVFDGSAGRLDQALASASLAPRITGVTEWHVNADEPAFLDYVGQARLPGPHPVTPYRASDHDPLLIGVQ